MSLVLQELRDTGSSSIRCPTCCPKGDVVGSGEVELSPFDDVDMSVVVEAVLLKDIDEDDLDNTGSIIIIGILFSSIFLSISLFISSRTSFRSGDALFPGVDNITMES